MANQYASWGGTPTGTSQFPPQNGFETIHQAFQDSPSMSSPEPQITQQTGGAEPLQKSNQSTPLLGLAGGASYGGQQSTNLAPMSSGASFGGGGTSGGGSSSSTFQQNPYLRDQMAALTGQYQQSFLQNTAPQLRASAMASGQYGGSRQGIAEGIAQGNAATGLASALGQLQAGTYNTDSNTWLQNKGLDNQYALGMGNLGLGYTNANNNYSLGMGNLGLGYTNANNNYSLGLGSQALQNQGQNQNFYTNNRTIDLNQYQLGASLANGGITGQQSVGQGQYNTGNLYQQAPMQAVNTYSQSLQPFTGYGQSNTTTGNSGGGATGALGGAMLGANLGSKLNFGSGYSNEQLGLSGYGGYQAGGGFGSAPGSRLG